MPEFKVKIRNIKKYSGGWTCEDCEIAPAVHEVELDDSFLDEANMSTGRFTIRGRLILCTKCFSKRVVFE